MKILLFYSLQLFSDAVWGRGFLFVHLNYTTSTIAYEFPKWGLRPPGDLRTECRGVREPNVGGSAIVQSNIRGPWTFQVKNRE